MHSADVHGSETTHPLALREQFDTADQQKDASTLGMWIFLITEVMFFGGMFLAYSIYRTKYPEVFAVANILPPGTKAMGAARSLARESQRPILCRRGAPQRSTWTRASTLAGQG